MVRAVAWTVVLLIVGAIGVAVLTSLEGGNRGYSPAVGQYSPAPATPNAQPDPSTAARWQRNNEAWDSVEKSNNELAATWAIRDANEAKRRADESMSYHAASQLTVADYTEAANCYADASRALRQLGTADALALADRCDTLRDACLLGAERATNMIR